VKIRNVLFLCTGNSARSVLGEAILNRLGAGRFAAFSAGSQPAGKVNPHAIGLLERLGYDTGKLRSKSWNEFATGGAPEMHFVFTVCDSAARESCPIWPGRPASAHWGIPDPAAVKGSDAEKEIAFDSAYRMLYSRIERFLSLPIASLDKASLQRELSDIGRSDT
jgi:protein-tyrosine-phosphatase